MNLAWNCRVCVWVAFSVCCAHACQATLEWIDQQHLAKTKMGYIFTLKFECHNSYNKLLLFNSESGDITWCNVNKYRMGFLPFFQIIKNQKTQAGCYFVKVSFSTLIIFQSCCDFPLIAWFGKSHVTISLIGRASLVLKKLGITGIWIRQNSVDSKTSFEKLNPCSIRS